MPQLAPVVIAALIGAAATVGETIYSAVSKPGDPTKAMLAQQQADEQKLKQQEADALNKQRVQAMLHAAPQAQEAVGGSLVDPSAFMAQVGTMAGLPTGSAGAGGGGGSIGQQAWQAFQGIGGGGSNPSLWGPVEQNVSADMGIA